MGRIGLAAALAAGVLLGQEPPTIRVETQLVDVEVVIRDSKGPVDNLTADDFRIFDKGKRQRITAFSIRRESGGTAQRPLSPTSLTNRLYRPEGRAVAPTVILLDTLNSRAEDMLELRRQLGLYLQRAAPNEPIAVYSLNKELTVIQDFTADIERLWAIVARWTASYSTDMNPDMRMLEDLLYKESQTGIQLSEYERAMMENVLREVNAMSFTRRADLTAYAFEEIANHLAGISGRKKLIWAGGSFPAQTIDQTSALYGKRTEVRNYATYLASALQVLNAAQVAVYPIDPSNPAADPIRDPNPRNPLNNTGQRSAGIDTMNLVANATGGKAFYALTDLAGAVEQVMEDAAVTYQLAFAPSGGALDGKYHDIRVEVARRGVELRYRKGYLAAESKSPDAGRLRDLMREAMEAPLDVTGIGLAVEQLKVPAGQPRQYVLRVDARDLQIQPGRIALVTLATFYPAEPELAGGNTNLDLTFTEPRLREVLENGYLGRVVVEHANASKLRIVVQDRSTGKTGSLTMPLAGATTGPAEPASVVQ